MKGSFSFLFLPPLPVLIKPSSPSESLAPRLPIGQHRNLQVGRWPPLVTTTQVLGPPVHLAVGTNQHTEGCCRERHQCCMPAPTLRLVSIPGNANDALKSHTHHCSPEILGLTHESRCQATALQQQHSPWQSRHCEPLGTSSHWTPLCCPGAIGYLPPILGSLPTKDQA